MFNATSGAFLVAIFQKRITGTVDDLLGIVSVNGTQHIGSTARYVDLSVFAR